MLRQRFFKKSSSRAEVCLIIAAVLTGSAPARAEYKLAPGDVVEITIGDIADLRQRTPVQSDGSIAVLRVGDIPVAGLSRQEMLARIKAALAATAIRLQGTDGHDRVVTVEADQVSAAVVEYRPVYVLGDVVKAGEQAFRIDMTARQALAIAGGLGPAAGGMVDPLRGLDLSADYRAAWRAYAAERAILWRLRAGLGSIDTFPRAEFESGPLPGNVIDGILADEESSLRAGEEDIERERRFVQQAIRQLDDSIAIITRQKADEAEGTAADTADLQSMLDLRSRGNATSTRVNEARRAVLLASTRNLQTEAELLRLQRQKEEVSNDFKKREDERRVSLLQQVSATSQRIDELKLRIAAAEEKMSLLGVADAVVRDRHPTLTIFRSLAGKETAIPADLKSPLEPGDVLEIHLTRDDRHADLGLTPTWNGPTGKMLAEF